MFILLLLFLLLPSLLLRLLFLVRPDKFLLDSANTQTLPSSSPTMLEPEEVQADSMDMDPEAVPSSSSTPSRLEYDVFLSFRGEDTRTNFTDHLYAALKRRGIHTFRDEEKLERGKEISPELLKAIEGSRSAVVVLSQDYASSTWCLDELAHIVQCSKERGLQVFPVFYHVETSEVRKQLTGRFGQAFAKHEEKFKNEKGKVRKWRKALSQVANVAGWDVGDRHESIVIQEIAKEISSILDGTSLGLNKDSVGMESRIEKIESYLI